MRSSGIAVVSGLRRALPILPLLLLVSFCAGRTPVRTTRTDVGRVDISQLWIAPHNLESRDLFYGPGGKKLAPPDSAAYNLLAVDNSGFSPGYDVRDKHGMKWSAKLGIEAQPEVVASRVLWAVGYYQPATYLVTKWDLVGEESGPQEMARFRRESEDERVVSDWSWYENPFVSTRPFKGLIVANLILNNWDWKTSNNKVYEVTAGGRARRHFVVRDLGASLGKTSFPSILKRTPLRLMKQGSRNDIVDFEDQELIKRVEGKKVEFDYRGIHDSLLKTVTVDDVIWTCRLMARISDGQWNDAFRAAAYDGDQRQRYISKLKSKIREGLTLADN
jgi:hypothetical protein